MIALTIFPFFKFDNLFKFRLSNNIFNIIHSYRATLSCKFKLSMYPPLTNIKKDSKRKTPPIGNNYALYIKGYIQIAYQIRTSKTHIFKLTIERQH